MAREPRVGIIRKLIARRRQSPEGTGTPTNGGPPGFYSIVQFRAALERERARADRNRHEIALALILARSGDGKPRPAHLVDTLRRRLRLTDEAGWFDQSHLGVLMPYTSCQGAWHMVEDLCRLLDGALSLSQCRVYIYPYDPPADGDGRCVQARICSALGGELLMENPLPSEERTSPLSESGVAARAAGDGIVGGPACVYPLEWRGWADPSIWQRRLDVVCSLLGLIVLAPVFILTAVFIRLVSPGPVFFKQVRVGRGGRPFVLWKFRTMAVDADSAVHQNHVAGLIRSTAGHNAAAAKPMTKLDNDPRVIPLGGVLRRTCLDELPQLINVLRGEMSLVGPRPPIPYEVEDYQPWQKRRLDAVPGLTGLWQVSGKNRLTFEEMVRLDIQYGRRKSFWMNVKIMLRTPRAIAQEIGDGWVRARGRVRENA
jgi:lipopolysaccharide/colanic/teichoic acid biosynthesis glycosyltransferase